MSLRATALVVGLIILGCAGPAIPSPAEPVHELPPAPVPPAPVSPDTGSAGESPRDAGDGVAEAPAEPPPRKVKAKVPAAAPTPPPGEGEEEPTSPAKRPVAPKPSGVVQLSDRSWSVTRKLVDQWQEDPYSLGNVRENGEGWELIGTRQRPAYHLGMRNGDILLEVNGHRLNSMVNLVAAYAACRNDTKFDVVFLRKGKRVTHHYEIKG